MKKWLFVAAVPCLLGAGWLGAAWWTGQQTESLVRQQVDYANQILEKRQIQGLKQELVSYERGLLGAKAVVRFNVEDPVVGKWLNKLQFEHDIHHGPLIFQDGIHLELSRWQSRFDLSQIDATVRQSLEKAFAGKNPLEMLTVVGFDHKAHSNVQMNPLSLVDDNGVAFKVAKAQANITVDTTTQTGPFTMQWEGVEFGKTSNGKIPLLDFKGEVSSQNSGSLAIQANGITVVNADNANEQVQFDFNASTDSHEAGDSLSSKGKVSIDNIRLKGMDGVPFTPQQFSAEGEVVALSLKGIDHLKVLFGQMQELAPQLSQSVEDPESLDSEKVAQAQEAMQKLLLEMTNVLFTEVLQAGKTRFSYGLKFASDKGDGDGNVAVAYSAEGDLNAKSHVQLNNLDLPETQDLAIKKLKQLTFDSEVAGINLQGLKNLMGIAAQLGEASDSQTETALMHELETTLFGKTLQANKSRVQCALDFAVDKGAGSSKLDVLYAGSVDKPLTFIDLAIYTPQDWVKLLSTTFNVEVDKALFPQDFQELASMQVEQKMLMENANRYLLKLNTTQDGQVEWNGVKMPVEEVLMKISQ